MYRGKSLIRKIRVRPLAALAMTLASIAGTPGAQAKELEEIVVTAQRRGESLQSVPITVSALTGDMAKERGINGTGDLQIVTPGLVIADSGIAPAIYLRGVGTQNTAVGDESSIALYVDGVYYSYLPTGLTSMINIERVEVLKGPQGTLFGRNATGGLMHIITRTPTFEKSLEASVTAANYETFGAQVYATGGLSETVAADISASYKKQSNGWGDNLKTGKQVYDGKDSSIRAKLLWQVSEDTEVLLSGDYSKREDTSASGAILEGALGLFGQPHVGGFYDINSNIQPLEQVDNGGGALKIQHDAAWARITSLSAFRTGDHDTDFDQDRGPIGVVDVYIRDNSDQFTQEFQLQSLEDSKISWIGGVFYMDSAVEVEQFLIKGLGLAAAGGFTDTPAKLDTTSWAAYAQATYPVTDTTNVTAGVRYTKDKRDLESQRTWGLAVPRAFIDANESWDEVTWRFAIDHHFTDDVMAYASYSRGFKSGVYNTIAPQDPPVEPEILDAIEVGIKTELFDNRVRLNASVFDYDYKDIQLSQAFQATTRILNAAKASVTGLDAELVALVAEGLTLEASLELLDGEYDEFLNAPNAIPNPVTTCPTPDPGPRTGGTRACTFDASGADMIRSPKSSYTLSARYEWDTSVGGFAASVNYFHTAKFNYEPNGRLQQPSYGLVNAQIGWTDTSDRYGVRLWGRNLTDEKYYVNSISSLVDSYSAAAPLTWGVTLDLKL